jgi:hypothetical protein
MIVNKYSVLTLFMAAVAAALSGVLAAAALWAAWRIRGSRGELDASRAERSIHWAALVAVVCLGLLLISWPLLYATLDSFVPEIPGAMCIYGVTKVMPVTVALIQAAKPAAIFLLGAWVLLESVRRQSGMPPRGVRAMLALAVVAGFMACAQGAELYYVFNIDSLNEVSCCSCCGDAGASKLQAPAFYLPWALPSSTSRVLLNSLFFGATPLLALWLLVRSRRGTPRSQGFALAASVSLLLAAAGIALVALLEFCEVLAPLLMRLPFHHCLYCLLLNGRAPDSPLIFGNMTIGCFAAGWAAVVGITLPTRSPMPEALRLHQRMCVLGFTTLLASVLMVVIHVAVYRG